MSVRHDDDDDDEDVVADDCEDDFDEIQSAVHAE